MSGVIGLVAVKRLSECKQRLSGVLSGEQRARLCLAMLHDVLGALQAAPGISATWATSPDPRVLSAALAAGARPVPDTAGTLNGALGAALAGASRAGARAVLLIQGDVPGVTAAEVEQILAAASGDDRAVVVNPTRDGGTGALYLRPPGALAPAFGPGSGQRHLAAAWAEGIRAVAVSLPGISVDVDAPADLAAVADLGRSGYTRAFLAELRRQASA